MSRRIAALVRHGVYRQPEGVPSAHLPYPLTGAGREQATRAAEELAKMAAENRWIIDRVIDSSRLLRAYETACIVRDGLKNRLERDFSVAEHDVLAERSVGALANLTVDQIEEIAAADPRVGALPTGWKRQSDYRLPFQGAESLLEAGERAARHLDERLSGNDAGEDTLSVFVGHGGAWRHAALVLGVLTSEEVSHLSMHHGTAVYIERLEPGRWRQIGGHWKKRKSHPDRRPTSEPGRKAG